MEVFLGSYKNRRENFTQMLYITGSKDDEDLLKSLVLMLP